MSSEATKKLLQLLNSDIYEYNFKQRAMELVKAGAEITIKATERDQLTLLHALIRNGLRSNTKEISELITKNPAILKIQDKRGRTALQLLLDDFGTSRFDDFKQTAMILARAGADTTVKATTKEHLTLLHILLRKYGSIGEDDIAELAKLNPRILEDKDDTGRTPLQVLHDGFYDRRYSFKEFKQLAMTLARAGADSTELFHVLLINNEAGVNNQEIAELLKLNPDILTNKNATGKTAMNALAQAFRNQKCAFNDFKLTAMALARDGADPTELFHVLLLNNKDGVNNKEIAELVKLNPGVLAHKDASDNTAVQALIREFFMDRCSLDTFKQSVMTLGRGGADLTQIVNIRGESLLHLLVRNNQTGAYDADITELLQLKPELITQKNNIGETALEVLLNVAWGDKKETFAAFKRTAMILANAGADITVQSYQKSYFSLLHILVLNGVDNNQSEIDKLIALNKDVLDCSDTNGHRPIHSLLLNNPNASIAVIEKLLSNENLHLTVDSGMQLLHVACHTGNLNAAKLLVAKGLELTLETWKNETTLHYAADSKNGALIEWLIQSNQINIHAQDTNGDTALHRAVRNGTPETVQVLLKHGADPTISNNKGLKPYQLAIQMKRADLLPLVFDPHQELLKNIYEMRAYGSSLQNKGITKGKVVVDLAALLIEKTNDFFNQAPEKQAKEFNKFQLEFSELLNSKNSELSAYRIAWGTVAKNIAIALTGIGLLLMAVQLIYSKATEGRPLFFFQKGKTTSEEKAAEVKQCMDTVEQSFASAGS